MYRSCAVLPALPDGADNERKRTCFWLRNLPPLVATGTLEAPSPKQSRGAAWAAFEGLPEAARAKAADRLRALDLIDTLHSNGASHVQAVAEAARQGGISSRSIYNWLEMVEGAADVTIHDDLLQHILDRNTGNVRRSVIDLNYVQEQCKVMGLKEMADWQVQEGVLVRASLAAVTEEALAEINRRIADIRCVYITEGITHFYSVLDEQTMKAELAAEQPETLTREQHLLLAAASSFISFTPPDLQGTLPEASARDLKAALDGLLNQGHLRRVRSNGTVVTYSAHSPKAAHSLARQRRKTAPGAMWQAIRIQKRFTAQDIHVALATSRPDITVRSAQDYCTMLTRAGYLRATQKARKDRPARYLLIRDTGPLPPVEKRLPVVIDGNDDVIVHAQGGRLV